SPDPVQRQQAQAFVARYGRSFLGTAANTATGGFTDYMMTKGQGDYPRGIPRNFEYYDPGELAFGTQLSRAIDPGGLHGAEMAGTAGKIAAGAYPAGRFLEWLRAANPLSGPPLEQPSIYENPEPEPPAINIRQRAQELEDRPKIVKNLQAYGREPPNTGK